MVADERGAELAARHGATVNVLLRNGGVIDYYMQMAFAALPEVQLKLFWWVLDKAGKPAGITRETFWFLIPAFIQSLTPEQLHAFCTDLRDFAAAIEADWPRYLGQDGQPVPGAGGAAPDRGEEGQRQDNAGAPPAASGDDGSLAGSNPGLEGRTEILPSQSQT